MRVLGLDVGGTSIKSGLVDHLGSIVNIQRTPTPNDPSGKELLATLAALIKTYQADDKPSAVGVCVPGIVDAEKGIAVFSGTLGWRNLPLVEMLTAATDLPVKLVHDVTASGLAELRVGAARNFSSAVVIAIGTGLAASIILDGKIYRPHPAVGEMGHVPTKNRRPCVCGKLGCLEMTCSGGALSRNYEAITGKNIPAHEIIDRAEAGESVASELWQEFLEELGFACHYIASFLGPEAIVIAGGFGYLGERIVKPLEQYFNQAISIQHRPQIVTSKLEGTSGCIGAGLFAIESLAR